MSSNDSDQTTTPNQTIPLPAPQDAPGLSITGTVANQATSGAVPVTPFATTVINDSAQATESVQILLVGANGQVSPSAGTLSGPGLTANGGSLGGQYNITASSAALATSELEALVFTPNPASVSQTTTLRISVVSQTGTTITGSAVDNTTSVVDAPTSSGTGSGGTGSGGTGSGGTVGTVSPYPFANLVASDPTGRGTTITVAASLLGTVTGAYSNLGSGTVSSDGKTYTVTGTPAAVDAALAAVQFTTSTGQATGVQAVVGSTPTPGDVAGGATSAALTDNGTTNDIIVANTGSSQVTAGAGTDTLFAAAPSSATTAATLVGGSASDVLAATTGLAVLVAGSGSETLFGGTGSSTLFGGTGASTLVGGAGQTSMVGGTGPQALFDGFGSVTVAGGPAAATIVGTFGNNIIALNANSNLVGSGNGNVSITASGSADTIIAGAGSDTMSVQGSELIFGATGALNLTTGAGVTTVVGGAGSSTINVNAGGGLFYGGQGGNNLIVANQGNATITGGGNGDSLYAGGAGPALLVGNVGNETLAAGGSTGNVTLIGGGTDVFTLGSGSGQVVGGPGGGTINDGSGMDVLFFVNGKGGSPFTVNGFKNGVDKVGLTGYQSNGAAYGLQVLANATVANGSTTISLSDNTKITFAGVTSLAQTTFF